MSESSEHHHHHHHHHHHSHSEHIDSAEKFKKRNLTYRKIRIFIRKTLFRLMIIAAVLVTIYALVVYGIGGKEEEIDAPMPMQQVKK